MATAILPPAVLAIFPQTGLAVEAQAFMADIMSGETSGDDPWHELAGGSHFVGDVYVKWAGIEHAVAGDVFTSHGEDAFQDEPGTEAAIEAATGIHDVTPVHQVQGNWYWAEHCYKLGCGRDLLADLKSGHLDPEGQGPRGLGNQWGRGKIAGPPGERYMALLGQLNFAPPKLAPAPAPPSVVSAELTTANLQIIGSGVPILQRLLVRFGFPAADIGGPAGPKTHAALMRALTP